jgi:hypothetical protein
VLDGGALASLDVLGKRPREEDKHLLDGATLEVAERRQLRSRGQDDRPVLARRRRCRRVHARVDHLHARGRLPVVVPRNGTSQQCAWPGSAASPAGHGGKSRNLVNFRIDMRYSVLSHSYKSYFYLRTFVGRQPGPSVDVRKTQSCRFYGSRHSALRYFPLEHIVFSGTFASEKCPRILGGKEGFKSRNLVHFRIDMRYSVLSHSYKSLTFTSVLSSVGSRDLP